jgi:hypothetical protein
MILKYIALIAIVCGVSCLAYNPGLMWWRSGIMFLLGIVSVNLDYMFTARKSDG